MRFEIYAMIIFGLFYFSEGKPCPEKTRPHKTHCEAYYKCFELPSKRHVWVPEKCESGLIYEHNLGLCVLPDDEWECTLGVGTRGSKVETNADVKRTTKTEIQNHQQITPTNKLKNADIHIINNKHEEDDEAVAAISSKNKGHSRNDVEVVMQNNINNEEEREALRDDIEIESSGDGVGDLMEMDDLLQVENRETEDHEGEEHLIEDDENEVNLETSIKKSKIDPKLTAHLQRLSQLIDGLKTQYQKDGEQQMELRPDQLNAFLAHFNIQNKFNLIKPTFEANSKEKTDTTTTEAPESTTTYATYPMASKNKTLLQEHLDNKLKPETKVVLTNALPKRYDTTGYSNSQIVVNRPEGSVLFTLPHYGTDQSDYDHNSPKISEETLKTVLELSKQMIATQNVPKIIPNAGYYAQPLIQPLFLPASAFQAQTQQNPFAAYFNSKNNNKNQQVDYQENDNKFSQFTGTYNNQHKPLLRPASSYSQPSNTIIHNNVIPVHLLSTNSGEKEIVDSYGQSLGLYPPLNTENPNGYQQHYGPTHTFVDQKFLASFTTERPQVSTTPTPSYAAQYAPSYGTDFSATTARPNDYQPTSPTLTEYFSPSPHLNDNNVNNLFQSTDRYPTVQYDDLPRPLNLGRPSLFAPHIGTHKVKLRPNGHKIESMEIESDDYNDNQARPLPQLFTYNYDNDKTDISNQYEEPNYSVDTGGNKHSYMPRPSAGATATRPTYTNAVNKVKPYNAHTSTSLADGSQLVNMGGNFVSYDVFRNTILPLLGHTQTLNELNNVEVITCATGVRQPNTTDCTRYYVCSKKDGKVLSYSCPPYTAFNAQSRVCDAQTYAVCTPDAIISRYTVSENKRLQLEAYKALQDAKRRQEQALKVQNIASLLQKYGGQMQASMVDANEDAQGDSNEKNILDAYVQQAAAMNVYSTTPKPTAAPVKKRKYYCKEGDKIADQTSANNYFVCYKNAQGMMKGHKMSCTNNLIFCSKNSMCTLAIKCA
uniref:Chitin-binding type-2 domain-containing protein n=1 Tax=Bactrocera latifrons TaxID=174628 RepID=A0A0K8W7Y6_BACLA